MPTVTLNSHRVNNAHAFHPVGGLRGGKGVQESQRPSIEDEDILVFPTAQQPAFAGHPEGAEVVLWNRVSRRAPQRWLASLDVLAV